MDVSEVALAAALWLGCRSSKCLPKGCLLAHLRRLCRLELLWTST